MGAPLQEKLVGLTVSYGVRTTPIKQIPPEIVKTLAGKLNDLWGDVLEHEMTGTALASLLKSNPSALFAMQKSFYTQMGLAEMATLQVHSNNFTFYVPRLFQSHAVSIYANDLCLKKNEPNEEAKRAIWQLAGMLDVSVHRAGKIFEFEFAPLSSDEKMKVFHALCPSIDETVGDFNHTTSFLRTHKGQQYNVVLQVIVPLLAPGMHVKVDINNRDMRTPLDPQNFDPVYGLADEIMPEWLYKILRGGA